MIDVFLYTYLLRRKSWMPSTISILLNINHFALPYPLSLLPILGTLPTSASNEYS